MLGIVTVVIVVEQSKKNKYPKLDLDQNTGSFESKTGPEP